MFTQITLLEKSHIIFPPLVFLFKMRDRPRHGPSKVFACDFTNVSAAHPAEAHPQTSVEKNALFQELLFPTSVFILITRVIVASLQVMARNERDGRVFREV